MNRNGTYRTSSDHLATAELEISKAIQSLPDGMQDGLIQALDADATRLIQSLTNFRSAVLSHLC